MHFSLVLNSIFVYRQNAFRSSSFLGYQLFNSLIIISFFDILDLLFSYSYKISSSFC
ncbi:hypothetical protein HOLDEFILI_01476 [Holdemania filiformis DSM 12042]|uniref:Uncharacterized protein n=1 Tax=Holdemania filiformis DSM 12042 TaxID=545696 RepID=B9Y6N3_9FIRM|nr:hypothetical protein HOLDEFILI_01476 [Holdemania filiformis DSM 12042]